MAWFDVYKPTIVMIGMQFIYAAISLSTRASLLQGMSPTVFVVYRQALATLFMAPIVYFTRRKKIGSCRLGMRSFCLIFLASLVGITTNLNLFNKGLYLVSSSMASAMTNLIPAITFIMSTLLGLEQVNLTSMRSLAKIAGTVLCVSGAISMAIVRGPKLLNAGLFGTGDKDWLLGCLLLLGSSCCWSFWLIIQVPVSESYPDHLSLSAWMSLMAAFQSAIVAFFLEKEHVEAWSMTTYFELGACMFAAIVSAMSYFAQSWCISKRGPFFSAMFNPLQTVVATVLACILLHEEMYTGGLVGALGVIFGLYIVLWGKAEDTKILEAAADPKTQALVTDGAVKILIHQRWGESNSTNDLKEPLLS